MDQLLFKTSLSNIEIKSVKLSDNEEEDKFVHLEGFAATFGNIDLQGDTIVKGAFTKTLADPDIQIKLLHQHWAENLLGVVETAIETDKGLFITAKMPKNIDIVRNLVPLLKMKALGKFSIGFNVVSSEESQDGGRLLTEIKLHEVSVVTFAANPKADITSVKKEAMVLTVEEIESLHTKREFEKMFMDTGVFTRQASILLASGFKDNEQRDSADVLTKQRDSVHFNKALLQKEIGKFQQLMSE